MLSPKRLLQSAQRITFSLISHQNLPESLSYSHTWERVLSWPQLETSTNCPNQTSLGFAMHGRIISWAPFQICTKHLCNCERCECLMSYQQDLIQRKVSNHRCVPDYLKCDLYQYKRLLERKPPPGFTTSLLPTLLRWCLDITRQSLKYTNLSAYLTFFWVIHWVQKEFSGLKFLKNYLQSTSGQERTTDIVLFGINCAQMSSLDLDKIVKKKNCAMSQKL